MVPAATAILVRSRDELAGSIPFGKTRRPNRLRFGAAAFYFLRETKLPPVEAFRKAGVPMALATDSNPGSAPVTSLLLMLNMACTLFRMTPEEALAGVTRHAAQALGLAESHGTLEVGKAADLCIWNIERPAELSYRIGFNPLAQRIKAGIPDGTNA